MVIVSAEREEVEDDNDVVFLKEHNPNLDAPHGWTKQINEKKCGGYDVVFISPSGVELKGKRQVEQYVKAHGSSPDISEFNWSTGGCRRRSRRLSGQCQAMETMPYKASPKRRNKSISNAGNMEKRDAGNQVDAIGEDCFVVSAVVDMMNAENVGDNDKVEILIDEVIAVSDTDSELKIEDTIDEATSENFGNQETADRMTCVEMKVNTLKTKEAVDRDSKGLEAACKMTANTKEVQVMNHSPSSKADESKKDAERRRDECDAPDKLEIQELNDVIDGGMKEEQTGSIINTEGADEKQ